jgi:hypothetical protein
MDYDNTHGDDEDIEMAGAPEGWSEASTMSPRSLASTLPLTPVNEFEDDYHDLAPTLPVTPVNEVEDDYHDLAPTLPVTPVHGDVENEMLDPVHASLASTQESNPAYYAYDGIAWRYVRDLVVYVYANL